MQTLTVFTPTYNRAECLQRLYHSLLSQSSRDFVWLVVDDGSTDETPLFLRQWEAQGRIKLRWFHTGNAGKHRAHNLGVCKAQTELFFCVDSDDYLSKDALEVLLSHWNRQKDEQLAGVIAYKKRAVDGSTGGKLYTQRPAHLRQFYQNGLWGDAALCYRTDLLKAHPFPEFTGEKFVTEHYVYAQIDQDYRLLPLQRTLVYTDYRPDGYTGKALQLLRENPKGWACYHLQCASYAKRAGERRWQLCQYVCYAVLSGEKQILQTCMHRKTPSAWVLGRMLSYKRRIQYHKADRTR